MNPDKTEGLRPFIWCHVQLLLVLVFLLSVGPALADDVTAPVTNAYPGAGTYQGVRDVSLYCFDGGTGCNSTFYCLGSGCTPTTPYNSPVSLSASSDLRFYSVDRAGNGEAVQTQKFLIQPDSTAPTTTPNYPGGTYGPISVYLYCSDGAGSGCTGSFYCLGTGCTPTTPYTSSLQIAASGELRFYSRDKSGNAEDLQTVSYRIDQVPPVTAANPPGGSYPVAPLVTLSCSDATGTGCANTYFCLGDNCTPTTSYNAPVPINDSTVLRFFSTDKGNNSEAVVTQSYLRPGAPKTITVPGMQPGIQSALDGAYNGDTVLVAPGTYRENLNFQGKRVTVTSEGGPQATVIDGSQAGPVVVFNSGETLSAVLDGFTLQNGSGTNGSYAGGGIYIYNAAPTVTNNIISGNAADWGGGIYIGFGAPAIRNNLITKNSAFYGGGVNIVGAGSDAQITGNTISENRSDHGAGLSLWAAGSALVKGNILKNNIASSQGGGVYSVNSSHASLVQNLIVDNKAPAGGAVFSSSTYDSFINNTLVNNDSPGDASCYIPGDTFINNIVVSLLGQTALFRNPGSANFSHNVIYAPVSSDTVVPQLPTEAANVSADPRLSDPLHGRYGLLAGSPAIDAGDGTLPSLPETDLGGMPRLRDGNTDGTAVIDIGAYEFDPARPVAQLQGIPTGFLTSDALTLTVSGTGVVSYRYALDGGAFSVSDLAVATPLSLSGLANGQHSLLVLGKNALGFEQLLEYAAAATWVVNTEKFDLNFSLDGASPWSVQALVSRDGIAYQSGPVTGTQSSVMETTVVGPGAIKFWWKVSAPTYLTPLSFSIDTAGQASVGGETDWRYQVYAIPAGSHTLRWSYSADSYPIGSSAGWVDQISFLPGSGIDVTPPTTSATPGAGTYASSLSVALSCSDGSASGCTGTLYCLGAGCIPAIPYSAPVTVAFATDLRFSSSDAAGNVEQVRTASYRFDTTPPTTYATLDAGIYSGPRDLSLYCSDNSLGCAATYYCLGSGCTPDTLSSAPITISSSTDLRYYSLDRGGNREAVKTLSFTITPDLTAPVTTISRPGGSYGAISVSLFCNDASGSGCAATYYCLGPGCTPATPFTSSTGSLYLSAATDVRFYSVDRSGNSEKVQTASFIIDSAAPVTSPDVGGGIYGAPQSVTLTCRDGVGSGCATTYYCLTQGCNPMTQYGGPIPITASTYLRYYSWDAVSNQESTKTERYTITTAAPIFIKVPADQPTIQGAINASRDGDTVVVAPGVYLENIDFKGKAITVTSSGGAEATVIDGHKSGPVVSFSSGEWQTSVLEGLTLRNGQSHFPAQGLGYGGGVYINYASPLLKNNRITGNFACLGGGIFVASGAPLVQGNLIAGNSQDGCTTGQGGGGIFLEGANGARIVDNTITDNKVPGGYGGGILANASGQMVISGNLIKGNSTAENASPCSYGGGIYLTGFNNSLISGNVIADNRAGCGGAVYMAAYGVSTLVNNSIVGSAQGTGTVVEIGYSRMVNNIVLATSGATPVSCASISTTSSPVFSHNLVYAPSGSPYAGCADPTGRDGNISADPKLSGAGFGYYGLRPGSPAIDAGDNAAAALPALDFNSGPRLIDGTGLGQVRVDLGAYEYDPAEVRAELSGAPTGATKETGAAFQVGGAGIVSYRYALDGGAFSAELPVATPLALSGLAGGSHAVAVIGKSATRTQMVSSATVAEWTIDSTPPVTTATPPGGSFTAPQSVTLSCSDGSGSGCAATFYCLGGGCTPDIPYSGPIAVSATAGLRYYSRDGFGYQEVVKTASFIFVANLSGVVTDSGTGAGLSGVSVQAYDAATGSPRGYGYTDLSGAYQIAGLPGGSYKLRFNASNYVEQWYSGMSDRAAATSVVLSAPGVTGALNVAMVKGGSISGTVTDQDTGVGIPNVYVYAYNQATGNSVGYGSTDNAGVYTVSGLPAGSYKLSFDTQNGSNYLSQWYSNKTDLASATAVTVTSANTTSGVSVALAKGGSLTGKVTDSVTGAGIPDVYVNLTDAKNGAFLGGTGTDRSGVYRFAGLAGTYKLVYSGAGYLVQWYGGKSDQGSAGIVSVTAPRETAGIDVTLVKGASISGMVTQSASGSALYGVQVAAVTITDPSHIISYTTTDNSGAYLLSGLSTGSYQLRFSRDGYVDQWYGGAADRSGAVAIVATAPNLTAGINMVLVQGAVITGRITDRITGAAAQGVTVSAVDAVTGFWSRSGYTDGTGAYSISGLASGKYQIQATSYSGVGYITQWYGDKEQQSAASTVTVTAPGSLAGVDITMEKGSVITGSVSDRATGAPLSNFWVVVSNASTGEHVGSGYSDGSGGYTVSGLPSGNYLVSCSATGYLTNWFDGKADATSATTIALSAPNAVSGINLALDRAGSISGTITDRSTGVGIANAYLSLSERNSGNWVGSSYTDSSGVYIITGLASGSYRLRIEAPSGSGYIGVWYGESLCADGVSVSAPNTTTGIDAQLELGGSISGRVTDAATGLGVPGLGITLSRGSSQTTPSAVSTATITADATGAYVVGGLASGDYLLTFSSADYLSSSTAAATKVTAPNAVTGQNIALVRGGGISGRVIDSSSGSGVYEVLVEAVNTVSHASAGSGTSDYNGNYLITGLPSGSYALYYDGRYAGLSYGNGWFVEGASSDDSAAVRAFASAPRALSVASTASVPDAVSWQTPAVVRSDLPPVSAVPVPVTGIAPEPISNPIPIFLPLPGVRVSYPVPVMIISDPLSPSGTISSAYPVPEAAPVSVAAPAITSGVDFAINQLGAISGRVSDSASGSPLNWVFVTVYDSLTGAAVGGTFSNSDGSYTLGGLPSGSYRVRFFDTSYANGGHLSSWYGSSDATTVTAEVSVLAPATSSGIDARLAKGGEISGTVTVNSCPGPQGVYLRAYDASSGVLAGQIWLDTDNGDAFNIGGLPAGSYRLAVTPAGAGFIRQWYPNQTDASSAQLLAVSAGTNTGGIKVVLAAGGGSISGKVAGDTGCSIASGPVKLFDWYSGGLVAETATRAQSYQFLGLPDASYKVLFTIKGIDHWYRVAGETAQASPVVVSGASGLTGIDLAMVCLPDGAVQGVGGQPVLLDAYHALRVAVELDPVTAEVLAHYDVAPQVDGVSVPDGAITVADALLILLKVVGGSP